jgi:hypothetical protein
MTNKIFFCFIFLFLLVCVVGCGQQAKEEKPEALSASISELITQNKSVRCVLQAKGDETIASGTTYVYKNQARSDYQLKMSGEELTNSHTITDGTYMYTWMDNNPSSAMKLKIADMQNEEFKAQAEDKGAGDYEDKFDYQCYKWQPEQSLFVPPSDINFTDYTEMFKQFQGMLNSPNSADTDKAPDLNNTDTSTMCSRCNIIPDAKAKASCLSSLGCK